MVNIGRRYSGSQHRHIDHGDVMMKSAETSGESHPLINLLVKWAVTFLVLFTGRAIAYEIKLNSDDPNYPHVHMDTSVEDTRIYFPDDAPSHFWDDESKYLADSYGKHFVFVGKLGTATVIQGQYCYGPVENFNYPENYIIVASPSELPESDTNQYVQIDGIVCGEASIPVENKAYAAKLCPIIKVYRIRKGDLQELASPVLREVEPKFKAKEDGFEVSVDSIVYRDKITSLTLTLTNLDNDCVTPGDLTATCGDKNLGYNMFDARKLKRYYWDESGNLPDSQIGDGTPILCYMTKGASYTAVYALEPADPSKDLMLELEFTAYNKADDPSAEVPGYELAKEDGSLMIRIDPNEYSTPED